MADRKPYYIGPFDRITGFSFGPRGFAAVPQDASGSRPVTVFSKGNGGWKARHRDVKYGRYEWRGANKTLITWSGTNIYARGKLRAVAPSAILGAAITKDAQGARWRVAVCQASSPARSVVYIQPVEGGEWQIIGEFSHAQLLPYDTSPLLAPLGVWAFNASGTQARAMAYETAPSGAVYADWFGRVYSSPGKAKRFVVSLTVDIDAGTASFSQSILTSAGYTDAVIRTGDYFTDIEASAIGAFTLEGEDTVGVHWRGDEEIPIRAGWDIKIEGSFIRSKGAEFWVYTNEALTLTGAAWLMIGAEKYPLMEGLVYTHSYTDTSWVNGGWAAWPSGEVNYASSLSRSAYAAYGHLHHADGRAPGARFIRHKWTHDYSYDYSGHYDESTGWVVDRQETLERTYDHGMNFLGQAIHQFPDLPLSVSYGYFNPEAIFLQGMAESAGPLFFEYPSVYLGEVNPSDSPRHDRQERGFASVRVSLGGEAIAYESWLGGGPDGDNEQPGAIYNAYVEEQNAAHAEDPGFTPLVPLDPATGRFTNIGVT